MRPGVTGAQVDSAQRVVMNAGGSTAVPWGTGHSVGYWAHDAGPNLNRRETRTLRWRLEELEAGRTATLNVTLRASRPGMLRSVVTVWSANHPEQTMHATVAPRTVVPISAPTRQVYPRSPVASGWPMSSPSFSSWPLGGGFRSGCAP